VQFGLAYLEHLGVHYGGETAEQERVLMEEDFERHYRATKKIVGAFVQIQYASRPRTFTWSTQDAKDRYINELVVKF
jgi:hypothetical protein